MVCAVAKPLVIVESPAKARTIEGFLGGEFTVLASMGHIRDLPAKGLSVDVEHDFAVEYEVHENKKSTIAELKKALKGADQLYLATDEDREGEAISWHLLEVLKPTVPVKRMVFHEITRSAIEHAIEEGRDVDYGLVDAQESRRIVDRLYGYPVSEVCWRKIRQGLSAGRVQSPSVRLVVERERERMAFVAASYWDLSATFPTEPAFAAQLATVDGSRVAGSRDFDSLGHTKRDDVAVLDEVSAAAAEGRSRRPTVCGHVGGDEAVHVSPEAAVHHLYAAAGGWFPTADEQPPGDVAGPGPLRGRVHHLHAHRQHHAVDHRGGRGAAGDRAAVRPRVPHRCSARLRQEVEERAGSP